MPFSWDLKLDVPLLFENISSQVDGARMELGQRLSVCRSQENGIPFSLALKLDVPPAV